eukprot:XP_011670628.1 PREDICTED: uncharacterized protein LOC105441309 [Strongylocentrotus purpuratus]
MPVSLGEWRVRIGTFMRRRRKEYDYHYFWRKLHNLIKKHKNAEPPKENSNPECNISSRTGSSPDANRSQSNTVRQSASSYNVSLNTAQTGPSRDVNNGKGNASSPTLSQSDGPQCDTVSESGFPRDVINPGHNDVSHSESLCAQNSGSSIEKETNPVPGTIDVTISVPQPCVEDELDNKDIAINLMSHEYTPKSAQISKTDKPEVGTSESHSHVPADVRGETDRINRDKEEISDSAPSGIEDQSSDLSPKHRLDTTNDTDQKTSSIREVTEYHESQIYPVLSSGTTSGEADETKGNDCPDMTNILLLRSGDVEQNPGPNDKPGNLTDLEIYLLADNMDPSDFRKVGLALEFTEAELSRFEKDQMGNTLYATYKMLYEWRKRVCDSEAREALVVTLQRIKLVQLADSVQKGTVLHIQRVRTQKELSRKSIKKRRIKNHRIANRQYLKDHSKTQLTRDIELNSFRELWMLFGKFGYVMCFHSLSRVESGM